MKYQCLKVEINLFVFWTKNKNIECKKYFKKYSYVEVG